MNSRSSSDPGPTNDWDAAYGSVTATDEFALSDMECWTLLASRQFGRLGYHLIDEVHIVPINYAADEPRILFRSDEGSKLLGVVMHGDIAFEIDHVDVDHAWSVVARGRARVLEGDEARAAQESGLTPWIDAPRLVWVCIEVTEVAGRRYPLRRGGVRD